MQYPCEKNGSNRLRTAGMEIFKAIEICIGSCTRQSTTQRARYTAQADVIYAFWKALLDYNYQAVMHTK